MRGGGEEEQQYSSTYSPQHQTEGVIFFMLWRCFTPVPIQQALSKAEHMVQEKISCPSQESNSRQPIAESLKKMSYPGSCWLNVQ